MLSSLNREHPVLSTSTGLLPQTSHTEGLTGVLACGAYPCPSCPPSGPFGLGLPPSLAHPVKSRSGRRGIVKGEGEKNRFQKRLERKMELHEVLERLDKQAAAIRDLRARVVELEQASATPSTNPPQAKAPLPPTCLICGKDKNGRADKMTCRACSAERSGAIRAGGAAREKFMTDTCALCARKKGRNTTIVCGTCRKAVRG